MEARAAEMIDDAHMDTQDKIDKIVDPLPDETVAVTNGRGKNIERLAISDNQSWFWGGVKICDMLRGVC